MIVRRAGSSDVLEIQSHVILSRFRRPTMNTVTPDRTELETAPSDRPEPEPETDQQRITTHVGSGYRITPIGARRFRCNRYARPSGLHATGWLIESFVLRVTSTSIERLSDNEAPSNRVQSW
jgi:hypothetical protein